MLNEDDKIATEIKEWNHNDINELKELLDKLDELCNDFEMVGIDITSLPSEKIPDDIDTGYPVWAMDIDGMCLVGESMDSIETLNEIRGLE